LPSLKWRTGIVFPDLLTPYISEKAQNSNQDSIRAHLVFSTVPVTGLIGALLIIYFQIIEIQAYYLKSPILLGEKPASLFPIGWQIPGLIGQYFRQREKTPVSIQLLLIYPQESWIFIRAIGRCSYPM
jgi:hypothetical protein